MNCLNCNKEVKQTEGKRQRKYCDDACKQIHWKKTHQKKPKYVQYKTFKELLDKFNGLVGQENAITANLSPSKQKDNKTQAKEVKKENKATETTNSHTEKESMPVWNSKLEKYGEFVVRKNKWIENNK